MASPFCPGVMPAWVAQCYQDISVVSYLRVVHETLYVGAILLIPVYLGGCLLSVRLSWYWLWLFTLTIFGFLCIVVFAQFCRRISILRKVSV
jgi:hypothetical protein